MPGQSNLYYGEELGLCAVGGIYFGTLINLVAKPEGWYVGKMFDNCEARGRRKNYWCVHGCTPAGTYFTYHIRTQQTPRRSRTESGLGTSLLRRVEEAGRYTL